VRSLAEESQRIIGRIEGKKPGKTLIVFGGIHGNEPAGVEALERVIEILNEKQPDFKGTFIAVRGNLTALKQNVRYLDEDMNRIWFPSIIDKIRRTPAADIDCVERREIKELLGILDEYFGPGMAGKAIFVDLHTFSAPGCMFSLAPRDQNHLEWLEPLQIPIIFGIEKTLHGTALKYIQDFGDVAFGIEGGQHEAPQAVENHVSALFLLLRELGCITTEQVPEIEEYRKNLIGENKNLPKYVELVYQHIVEPEDEFKMREGFSNFQEIRAGEWLACDRNGKIIAQSDGYILMPLYQEKGNDGFFIVQECE